VNLRGSPEELSLIARNYWVYDNAENFAGHIDPFLNQTLEEAAETHNLPVPILFISFPSAKDPNWNDLHPGKSSCIVIGAANRKWFTEWDNKKVKKRGDEYDHLKRALAERYMDQFKKVFPHLADKIDDWDIGTPSTHKHYLAAPNGEICGLDHSVKRFSAEVAAGLRPKTDIPGLFLTGQDISMCGFAGAMYGGMLCASSILNRNLMVDLMNVKKERASKKKKN